MNIEREVKRETTFITVLWRKNEMKFEMGLCCLVYLWSRCWVRGGERERETWKWNFNWKKQNAQVTNLPLLYYDYQRHQVREGHEPCEGFVVVDTSFSTFHWKVNLLFCFQLNKQTASTKLETKRFVCRRKNCITVIKYTTFITALLSQLARKLQGVACE